MFSYYNNESLRKLVVGFGNLFNDMYVAKFDDDNNIVEKDRVPLTYGPKEKFIRRIKEVSTISDTTRTRITLPRMGFEMLGMSYDPTRKANKLRKTSGGGGFNYAEVPYLVNFGLYTFTRNIDENLQLVEQILPIFSPEFIISMNFNDINKKVNVPIILTSTGISEIYEGDFSETRSITTTFSFIAKTYIYGEQKGSVPIENADINFYVGTDIPNIRPEPDVIEAPDVRDPVDDAEAINVNLNPKFGPFAVQGYYPLYTTADSAVAASPDPTEVRPGETTVGYHIHAFDGVKYYMPNGLVMNRTQFHGNYPDIVPADIPTPPDPGTEIDPDVDIPSIIVAGGKLDVPYKPSLVQNGANGSMYYIGGTPAGLFAPPTEKEYRNETDEEFRQRVRDYLAGEGYIANAVNPPDPKRALERWLDEFGEDPTVVRSTYLNEDTTGWILLDWEKPLNLGGALSYSDEQLTWWVQGVIRRINILREFLPNARFGLWRFGQGRNPRFDDEESILLQLEKQIFASNVEYKGKTLFDSLDFLSPALYHGGNEDWTTSGAEQRVLDGVRVQRCKDVCNAIFAVHGEVKPVIPIISYSPVNLDTSYMPNWKSITRERNAVEIDYFRGYVNHWAFWFAYPYDLIDYYEARDSLIRYYDQNYSENNDSGMGSENNDSGIGSYDSGY